MTTRRAFVRSAFSVAAAAVLPKLPDLGGEAAYTGIAGASSASKIAASTMEPEGLTLEDIRRVREMMDAKKVPIEAIRMAVHPKVFERSVAAGVLLESDEITRDEWHVLVNPGRLFSEPGVIMTDESYPGPTSEGLAREAQREMPRYRSHKTVWALKIRQITPTPDGGAQIIAEHEGYGPIRVPLEYVRRHEPEAGGYYVVYEDGYESWSPADAFEGGYTRIDEQRTQAQAMTDTELGQALASSPSPVRVTKTMIQDRIKRVDYHRIGETVSICSITLDNGFSVRGDGTCVDPSNFVDAIDLAYEDAFRKLWPLFGFLLAEDAYRDKFMAAEGLEAGHTRI